MGCQLLVQLTQIEQTIDLPHQMIGWNYPIEIQTHKGNWSWPFSTANMRCSNDRVEVAGHADIRHEGGAARQNPAAGAGCMGVWVYGYACRRRG
jgi:hypothetical protein